jgi:hypothetical protein
MTTRAMIGRGLTANATANGEESPIARPFRSTLGEQAPRFGDWPCQTDR